MTSLLSATEVAVRAGLDPGTVRRWAHDGAIPSVPYGAQIRFDEASVAAVLALVKPRDMKTCGACGRELPLADFRAKRDLRTSRPQTSHDCNDCHKAYNEALRRKLAEASGRAYRTRQDIERERAERRAIADSKREAARAERAARPRRSPAEVYRERYRTDPEFYERERARLWEIVPLSAGGEHTLRNVALAHKNCNSRRGAGRVPVQSPLFHGGST